MQAPPNFYYPAPTGGAPPGPPGSFPQQAYYGGAGYPPPGPGGGPPPGYYPYGGPYPPPGVPGGPESFSGSSGGGERGGGSRRDRSRSPGQRGGRRGRGGSPPPRHGGKRTGGGSGGGSGGPPSSSVFHIQGNDTDPVSFSLLLPVFSIKLVLDLSRELVKTIPSVEIIVTPTDVGSGDAARRVVKFSGPWPDALAAQRQVLEKLPQADTDNGSGFSADLSAETLALVPKELAPKLALEERDIERQTNTMIRVYQPTGGSDARNALVVIRGGDSLPEAERRAKEKEAVALIRKVVALPRLPSELPQDDSEEYTRVDIPVASRYAGSVIGRNASVVRELEQTTGARINLSREGTKVTTPTETLRFVTAEGTITQVRSAHALIVQHVEAARKRSETAAEGKLFKVPLSVPDHLIGVIIGKGGKMLRDLQEESTCKIHIEHTGRDDRAAGAPRLVEISGEMAKVEKTQRIVVERLIDAAMEFERDGGHPPFEPAPGGGGGGRRPRSRSPPGGSRGGSGGADRPHGGPGGSTEFERLMVSVPKELVGAVIGNRGARVREICDMTGSRIHIEGKEEMNPGAKERVMTISGQPNNIIHALEFVQRALTESNETRVRPPGSGPDVARVVFATRGVDMTQVARAYPPHLVSLAIPQQLMAGGGMQSMPIPGGFPGGPGGVYPPPGGPGGMPYDAYGNPAAAGAYPPPGGAPPLGAYPGYPYPGSAGIPGMPGNTPPPQQGAGANMGHIPNGGGAPSQPGPGMMMGQPGMLMPGYPGMQAPPAQAASGMGGVANSMLHGVQGQPMMPQQQQLQQQQQPQGQPGAPSGLSFDPALLSRLARTLGQNAGVLGASDAPSNQPTGAAMNGQTLAGMGGPTNGGVPVMYDPTAEYEHYR